MNEEKTEICYRCKCDKVADVKEIETILSKETKEFLLENNLNIFCKKCLQDINTMIDVAQEYKSPLKNKQFIEGIHYYKENNYIVFTEMYHFLKGYCCKNSCRHCIYGFKK